MPQIHINYAEKAFFAQLQEDEEKKIHWMECVAIQKLLNWSEFFLNSATQMTPFVHTSHLVQWRYFSNCYL